MGLYLVLEAQEKVPLVTHLEVHQEVLNQKPLKDPAPIHLTTVRMITSMMVPVQEYVAKVIHLRAHQWPQHRPLVLQP